MSSAYQAVRFACKGAGWRGGWKLGLAAAPGRRKTAIIYIGPPVSVRRFESKSLILNPAPEEDPVKVARHLLKESGGKLGITATAKRELKAIIAAARAKRGACEAP